MSTSAIEKENKLSDLVSNIFFKSRKNYGTRKIKIEMQKANQTVSRRKIARIMKQRNLVSNYAHKTFKPHSAKPNEAKVANVLDRNFNNQATRKVLCSDLTYVRVNNSWNYVCFLVDLSNREIVGYSSGKSKDAQLVAKAFYSIKGSLSDFEIFHTDRGSEFDNKLIENILETFKITRSLSKKGCPYDNAVSETTFKLFKTELIYGETFNNLEHLQRELSDYVNWFNNIRIHSSLNYLTPVEFKQRCLNKIV